MGASAESIEGLYRSRYASFRGGLAAITGSHERAHDVVQEAFAQALRDREQFRGEDEASLAAWVWRIAFRVAARGRGADRRELALEDLVESGSIASPERDPLLAQALRRLSPQRRLVVFLRYFADLSYAEVASLCGISEGTVAATLAHAHADLLRDLQPEEAHR
jgi:RNA polymerase sigma factor (sigma-70 family)